MLDSYKPMRGSGSQSVVGKPPIVAARRNVNHGSFVVASQSVKGSLLDTAPITERHNPLRASANN